MENKSEKLSQPRGTYGGLTTQCNSILTDQKKGQEKIIIIQKKKNPKEF